MEYQKIQTVFKRDKYNVIIPTEYTLPEFKWLAESNGKFEATEKIDGTNTRVNIQFKDTSIADEATGEYKRVYEVDFAGRTDKAQMPAHLEARLHELFDNVDWNEIFTSAKPKELITLYGEGYDVRKC